jgi:ATP-dependent RNA helicase RhlE
MPFASLGLDARLLDAVRSLGWDKPTPIQLDAVPPGLAGRDVLACAATGSGKTAAFLLPVLQRLLDGKGGRVRALVLTPTRELAAQIDEHRRALVGRTGLTGAAVYGGVGMGPQETALRRGVDVVVATPGRLLDHLQHPYTKFDGLEVLVLDEADRMLDMGFLPDVRRILARLPKGLQVLLFSATLPPEIVRLAAELQSSPVRIALERKSQPATGVTQTVWPVAQELKTHLLLALLESGELESALVFTRTKHRANRVADWLAKRGVNAARIHGNRSQSQRTEALDGFKKGRYRVLVATDVAARGIDIEALPHVVNFDVPAQPDDYIHRVGRTARAEREGDAWTFFSPQEEGDLRAIERAVGRAIPRRQLAGFDYTKRSEEKLEIPLGDRIAAIRSRKAEERKRAAEKAARRAAPRPAAPARPKAPARTPARPAGARPAGARRGERVARPAEAPRHEVHHRDERSHRPGPGSATRPTHRPAVDRLPWWLRRDA